MSERTALSGEKAQARLSPASACALATGEWPAAVTRNSVQKWAWVKLASLIECHLRRISISQDPPPLMEQAVALVCAGAEGASSNIMHKGLSFNGILPVPCYCGISPCSANEANVKTEILSTNKINWQWNQHSRMFWGIFKERVCTVPAGSLEMLVVATAYSGFVLSKSRFLFPLLLPLKYSTWHFLYTNRILFVDSGSTWEQGKLAKTFKS